MRRSGALTLGVVLTLGAVTGGQGQELSGSVTSGNGSAFVLPSVPENWADLPFKLTASQTVSYNSNVNGIPIGTALPGQILGDFTTTSNFGFSTRANVSGQQLFLDATFGVIRYLHDVAFDSTVYSLNAGVDWTLTSRCSGALSVSLSKSPAARIEYAKGYDTLTALASISVADFTGRTAAQVALGLATQTDFHSFTLNYTRQINANLSVTGLIGLVGTTDDFTLGLPKSLLPIYTLSTTWAFTPKLSLSSSLSRTIAPPTTVIANAQTSYDASVTLGYQMTPKVSVNAGGSIDYSISTSTSGLAQAGISPIFTGTQRSYSLTAGVSYTMTPFLTAALNASYTERVGNGFITPQDLVTVSLNYRPY